MAVWRESFHTAGLSFFFKQENFWRETIRKAVTEKLFTKPYHQKSNFDSVQEFSTFWCNDMKWQKSDHLHPILARDFHQPEPCGLRRNDRILNRQQASDETQFCQRGTPLTATFLPQIPVLEQKDILKVKWGKRAPAPVTTAQCKEYPVESFYSPILFSTLLKK